jgi:type I restriction enzyme, R subunit
LFKARLELIAELDKRQSETEPKGVQEPPASYGAPATEAEVRRSPAEPLQCEVAAMHLDNFGVRPRRRLVER